MCNVKDLILGIAGWLLTLGITYFVAWDVPWLLIMSGAYLLGIVIAYGWEKWTGYNVVYSPLVTIVALVAGVYLMSGKNAYTLLMFKWCGIPPCVPLYWLLLVLIVGNAVWIGRQYIFDNLKI